MTVDMFGNPRTDPFAEVRHACPALDGLLSRVISARVDQLGKLHIDPDCHPGQPKVTTFATVEPNSFCQHCASAQRYEAVLIQGFAKEAACLLNAPQGEQPAETLIRAARRYLDSIAVLERTLREMRANGEGLASFVSEVREPWERWFRTEGVRQLLVHARCAGPTTTIGPVAFGIGDVPLPNLRTTTGEGIGPFAMRELIEGQSAEDPIGVALEELLARDHLFNDDVVDGDPEQAVVLLRSGMPLSAVVERIRQDERRREALDVLRTLEAHTTPATTDHDRTVVVAREAAWTTMFWSDALRCSFPSATSDGVRAVAVPKVVADKIITSLAWNSKGKVVVSTSPHLHEPDAVVLVGTVMTLLDDGMEIDDAMGTATAVLR